MAWQIVAAWRQHHQCGIGGGINGIGKSVAVKAAWHHSNKA